MSDDDSGDDWEALEDAGKIDTDQIGAELKRLKRAEAERVRLYEILSRPRQSNFADSEAPRPPRIQVNPSTSDSSLLKELSDQNGIQLAMQWDWDDPMELNSEQRGRAPGNKPPEDKITDVTDVTDDEEGGLAAAAAAAVDVHGVDLGVSLPKGHATASFGRIGADKATAIAAADDTDDASWDAAGQSAAVAADEAAENAGDDHRGGDSMAAALRADNGDSAATGDRPGSDYEYVSTDPDDDLESDRCDSDYDDHSLGGGGSGFNLFGPDPAASGPAATAGLPGLKIAAAAAPPTEKPGLFDGMTVCDECGVPKLKGYTDAEVDPDLWYCTACWSIWLAEKADEERRRTVAAIYAEHDREVDGIVDGMEANTDKTNTDVMQKLLDLVLP